jgi:hypothetical protein
VRKAGRDRELRQRLKELAARRMRFGYRRLTAILVSEVLEVNHKMVCRLRYAHKLFKQAIIGSGCLTRIRDVELIPLFRIGHFRCPCYSREVELETFWQHG